MEKTSRSEVAAALKDAAISYLIRQGYSCYLELGLNSWGKLRADVLAVNLKGKIVIAEIKSCTSDFKSDKKWHSYLPYCNRFYFVMRASTAAKLDLKEIRRSGAGLLVLDADTGYLKSVFGARKREVSTSVSHPLVLRMAWRAGISKRCRRRKRHFL